MKLSARPVLLALLLLGAVSTPARADEPTKQARVTSAPSSELTELLAKAKAKLGAEQQAMLAAAVADARQRLVASERDASSGKAERLAVDAVLAAALVDAGLGKTKSKLLPVYAALATMQLSVDLQAALRDRLGRRAAIAAVRACKGEAPCLTAITPTVDMSAEHIAAARKAKDLEAEDRLGNFEIQTLSSTVSRVKTSDKQQKAVLDFIKG